jgi:hypothetical protein
MNLIDRLSNSISALFAPRAVSRHGYPNPEFDPRVHEARVLRWQSPNSDERLRTNYECLAAGSIVLDLGGFHGDFALRMNAKYGAVCHVFEVVRELCDRIRGRIAGNPAIVVQPFGVDLMKINIEGGEYELLEHLIARGLTKRIRNIQVQFHEDVMAGAAGRMERIQSRLAETHHLTYQERSSGKIGSYRP